MESFDTLLNVLNVLVSQLLLHLYSNHFRALDGIYQATNKERELHVSLLASKCPGHAISYL